MTDNLADPNMLTPAHPTEDTPTQLQAMVDAYAAKPDHDPETLEELKRIASTPVTTAATSDNQTQEQAVENATGQQDDEQLREAIAEQFSRAYYNGLDSKGWSHRDENDAVDAVIKAAQLQLVAELLGEQTTVLHGSPTKHEVIQAVSVEVLEHKKQELEGRHNG